MAKFHIENLNAKAFSEHFAEMLRVHERTIVDSAGGLEGARRVWEARVAFTEKLILLDTGMFALTLSFLGAIGSHAAAKSLSPFSTDRIRGVGVSASRRNLRRSPQFLIVRALEHLFIVAASVRNEYRFKDCARMLKKTFSFLKGRSFRTKERIRKKLT